MATVELKPNSHKYREAHEAAKAKKEIKQSKQLPAKAKPVKVRKKPLGKKLAETFVSDDVETVRSYIFFDVLVPAIKDTIADIVKQAVDMFLFGDSRRSTRQEKPYGRVSYSSYYDRDNRKPRRPYRGTKTHDFYDIFLESRGQAKEVLDDLQEIIEQYDAASIAQYYELCEADDLSSYTDNKYGWTDLSDVTISLVNGEGYMINLPKAVFLER